MSSSNQCTVIEAGTGHLGRLLPLFAAYREFYEQKPDPEAEEAYLAERMQNRECTVFIAEVDGNAAGFVLTYPTWDSVKMSRVVILHDLYVAPGFRRYGIGRRLMDVAHEHCRKLGASRVDLMTALTNTIAQPLYESIGYEREEAFYTYSLAL